MPRDDEAERRQLRDACLEAMPLPGQAALRVSLFQWARWASPQRVLRILNTIDSLTTRVAVLEGTADQQMMAEAKAEDDATLLAAIEADWDDCRSLVIAFHHAISQMPGAWPDQVRDVMHRTEAAGLHRFGVEEP